MTAATKRKRGRPEAPYADLGPTIRRSVAAVTHWPWRETPPAGRAGQARGIWRGIGDERDREA